MREDFTTDPDQIYQQYENQVTQNFIPQDLPVTAVTNINGAAGPNVTFNGTAAGFSFSPAGNEVIFSVSNAATARTALGAAKSGANDNINTFTALTGNTGWSAWTGTSDKTAHATYSGTASVGYVQAELQGVMDKLKQITEAYKALQDVLLGIGITEA